jgi:hypothetical protein
LTGLCGSLTSWFTLDHDVKVDKLFGKGGHVILKAKGVFADGICGEDKVALSLTLTVKKDLVIRVFDFIVYVKRASGLHLGTEAVGHDAGDVQIIRTAK